MRHLARQHAHCPGTFSASTPGVAVWDCADGSTMPTIAEEMPTIAEETLHQDMLAGYEVGAVMDLTPGDGLPAVGCLYRFLALFSFI